MNCLTLESSNRAELADALLDDRWTVACLCAQWCDVCCTYRPGFEKLAERHPNVRFVWIDIEDQDDVVGELDIENFPTLLLQRGATVAFFGMVVPDPGVAERLLLAQIGKTLNDLVTEAHSSVEHQRWQRDANLLALLNNTPAS